MSDDRIQTVQRTPGRWPVRARRSALASGLRRARRMAQEKVTYLFPAPPILPAFGPIQLAKGKGYFTEAGLDVDFQVARGGVEVAKQVGAGNAPIGGIVADGPIMVRGNGVPVKIVAVFGGKGFMQTVVREDSGIEKPADLKGKTLTVHVVPGHDVLCAARACSRASGLTQNDVNIQAGRSDRRVGIRSRPESRVGMAGVPDWIPPVQAAGVKVKDHPDRRIFPAHGAGHRGVGSDDQGEARDDPEVRHGRDARHEGHDGRSEQGGRRFREVRAGMEGQGRRRQGRVQLLRQAGLCRPEASSARSIPSA